MLYCYLYGPFVPPPETGDTFNVKVYGLVNGITALFKLS